MEIWSKTNKQGMKEKTNKVSHFITNFKWQIGNLKTNLFDLVVIYLT